MISSLKREKRGEGGEESRSPCWVREMTTFRGEEKSLAFSLVQTEKEGGEKKKKIQGARW